MGAGGDTTPPADVFVLLNIVYIATVETKCDQPPWLRF